VIKTIFILLNVAQFYWISRASFTHFNRGEKEPLQMLMVRVLTTLGFIWNLYVAFTQNSDSHQIAAFAILTFISSLIFASAIKETKGNNLPVAFSFDKETTYVVTGIYRFIRHPFYASYILYWLSWTALNYKSILSLTFSAILIFAYLIAIRSEEQFLRKTYDLQYLAHKKISARVFPYLY